ncbi:hypothetical protein CAPTEDRAFT_174873 [Capitella teleta]|uniref:F-box domain-containing protein n=1 Tax=Capitella teleta TaxID=283909 RepID=R7UEM9_CAPTE|nr:hypothetical protein CAPTEDRAFT_174873 [Capitella teleta]|eukprot:ELU04989.1 hypothetical protein CAPTEDRAFT_174873 [Capitella teleta]
MEENSNNNGQDEEGDGGANILADDVGDRDDDVDEEDVFLDGWAWLPDILLEEIFAQLTHRQRYYCSMVCRHWYSAFKSFRVWKKLEVGERTFTYRRFNLYKGYQNDISHHRVQMCLARIGSHVQHLEILPIYNFFNLYEFLNVLACYLEFFDEFPMSGLQSFKFTFACESRGPSGSTVHGTGGKILQQLKRLIGNMRKVRSLTINNLLLDSKDFLGLLDDFVEHSGVELRYLEVRNITKRCYPFTYAGNFVNLETLVMTPNQLSVDVLLSVAKYTKVKKLVLLQDNFITVEEIEPLSSSIWWEVKQLAPQLRVRLEVMGPEAQELIIQEKAPVQSVVFKTPLSKARDDIALVLSDEYSRYLNIYCHLGLPRVHGPRSFHCRGDSSFLLLLSGCPNMEVLVINERISTATLLMLASRGQHLKELCVRKNALILKCDWPRSSDWDNEYYLWFKTTSRSYEKTEAETKRLLGNPFWKMLTDWEFKRLDF